MLDRLSWTPLPAPEAKRLALSVLYETQEPPPLPGTTYTGRVAPLPFYETFQLYHLTLNPPRGAGLDLFALASSETAYLLDGSSAPIRYALGDENGQITSETAPDYLRLFCFGLRSGKGAFVLFEQSEVDPEDIDSVFGDRSEEWREHARMIAELAAPLNEEDSGDGAAFCYRAPVQYSDHLWSSRFGVEPDGHVEMLEDDELAENVPPELIPSSPALHQPRVARLLLEARQTQASHSGRKILNALVQLLLESALAKRPPPRILAHFNARREEGEPLERFARFVTRTHPVVAIESALPFVEDTVAELIGHWVGQPVPIVRPSVSSHDDTRIEMSMRELKRKGAVTLIPLHAYRGVVDVDRVAHMLGAHDVACLIGCAQLSDVPWSLRQVVDLTLELPRLTPELFGTLFERVMGTPPPEGWDEGDTHWVTHVHHADFQHPEGLELTPEETLEHVRDRAASRLRDVEPVEGLGLGELHGLGEARRFAEDLITDIHEAMSGDLDWDQVDRGMLLAGAPGTGKTTLARAIAKDCGIRFVNSSAAGWQAAGYLNDHIRAMRADFQLARRFAPSILFIDEIDSIGSRERFNQGNTQYHTQVVNALLEQIQGIDPEAPVIVIAATNHPDRVDPALKRSGRLDHVIEIPRPNARALADIFRHYLGEHPEEKRAEDIDPEGLGGLAFGLTGADVERIVRGAARRARRADRPMRQSDLIDEITRKPRDESTSPRLTPEEIRRVAVHEAGHALAAYRTASRGEDISFVSIVPRADGTLGFVAQIPSERALVTRREYLERLEVILGGRAAEEIVFGEDGVTGGARSDLKVATQSAIQMTTQLGLGPEGSLLWSETSSDAQKTEAGQVLAGAYETVLGKLRADANELTKLADALEEQQELTGEEVRTLLVNGTTAN